MTITRTFDLLSNLKASFPPKDDMLARKVNGRWIKYSIDDYIEHSHNVAYGLLALGYKAGTKIITICSNRPEWNFVDMGSNLAHMIHVPVYSTLSKKDYLHIFDHSDAEIIIVGTKSLYNKIAPIASEIKRDIKLMIMDDSDEIFSLSRLEALGIEHKEQFAPVVERNKAEISPDECCSIVYTSGTTGLPKGVMLSHRNLTSNAHGHAVRQVWNWNHKMLSFLPLSHVYERTMNYEYQELAIGIYYAESLSTIAADLAESKADGFCAVPRVLELMYGKLEAAGKKLKGIKRIIYKLAWKFANNFDFYNKKKLYLARRNLYDKLVYSKWRAALGGKEMIVVSGGSSIQAKIVRTFNAAKLHIYEGYGMTETSPVIAVNSPADGINVIGTVGKALGGTELSFAEDGEILTRGPHIMLGYYKDPEATAQIIDSEGWLHTGDIGYLIDGQYLKITDRKKEIFKLSAGKYVAPQVIETRLKESPYIENCIVFGENQKFASAIIIPSIPKLKEYAQKRKIEYNNDQELIAAEEIVKLIHSEVEKVNKTLAAHEAIKREKIVLDDWSAENDLLSQTLKLKRRNIHKKYANLINEIFKSDKLED
jgi:long-chain acyl-CoA synthetase